MRALIIYESMYGNTERIARAVEHALSAGAEVDIQPLDKVTELPHGLDLLVVGGPTYAHGLEAAMKRFLDRLPQGALEGIAATAFDTRVNWPRLISGAASTGIAERLERKGARVVADPESFLVEGKEGPLLEGEEARASAWEQYVLQACLPHP